MSKYYAVLLTTSFLVGCASAPEQSAQTRGVAETVQIAANTTQNAEVTPDKVIDLNAVVDDSASTVVCRDMLKQGSNVIVTQCLTRANWKKFERREAREAERFVRMLQGNPYGF